MELIIKNVQIILGILSEHLGTMIAIATGILSLVGVVITNKLKNDNEVSKTNKKTNKIP